MRGGLENINGRLDNVQGGLDSINNIFDEKIKRITAINYQLNMSKNINYNTFLQYKKYKSRKRNRFNRNGTDFE
ncbi:hypothetical protein [Brachyspira catarrhinii]|uniref:t-SNARE coiled-coil homology domain-containing protein n=1 Tax=Brachyspira catarrhinii TaxID=2528966 RepID=A0ABY2TR63_9SPIR|nr:hypothetical protein [Brachyspira catarrhinii]TKZ35342.1 hypothetical protein EZH24_05775 [Brachyspira catarrhinii]